jgi:RNA polymerase sigma-70 factor (ECF subfamily)
MEDKLLVLRCKRGSKEALARIYAKYKHDLLLLAMALLNDASAAEDVVHDVFVSFVHALGKFRLTGSLKGYLLTCAANCARNRNKARLTHLHAGCAAPKPVRSELDDPVRSSTCNEQLQRLSEATAQLPYEQKEVVILHLHGAMTFEMIAKAQGISANTAKSRYRYGLDKLRLILNEEAEK